MAKTGKPFDGTVVLRDRSKRIVLRSASADFGDDAAIDRGDDSPLAGLLAIAREKASKLRRTARLNFMRKCKKKIRKLVTVWKLVCNIALCRALQRVAIVCV
jgi:hypothetical protein